MSVRPRVLLAVVLAAVFGCRRTAAPLDDVQRMTYGVKPSIVRLNAYATATFVYQGLDVPTGAGGSGSGFIVHPDGLILTSGHVVAPTRDPDALRHDLLRNGAIAALVKQLGVEKVRALQRGDELESYINAAMADGEVKDVKVVHTADLSNGEKLPFRILRYSPTPSERGADLALLQVDRKNLPVATLGDSEQVHVGDSIWAVGYPVLASSADEGIGGWLSPDSDLEATVAPGVITAIKRNVSQQPVFQSNVAIYRGNSGGPDVNLAGEVIAISTWGHSGAEAIKFLVPVNVAKSFLADAGVAMGMQSEFTRHYRAALDAAGGGNWTAARDELARAGALFANSPDVIRFGHDVDRALKGMPLWRRYPIATAALIVAAIGVLLVIAIARTRRPRIAEDMLKVTTETMVSPSSVPPGRPLMLGKFTILNGTRAGERLGLGGSGIRIGRESTICEIVLENPKVSRLHAEVVSMDGKVLLIDRNSSNGTYVNDQKIDKRFLKDGDIIYFGGRNAVAVAFHAA
jgi:S1-C subfamily serine protease